MVGVWDIRSGRLTGRLKAPFGPVFGVRFLPDDRHLVVCGKNGAVHLYEVTTAKLVPKFVGHEGDVWSLSLSADGRRLLTGDLSASVCVWDVISGKRLRRFDAPTRIEGRLRSP